MNKPEQRDPNRCAAHVEDLEHRHATSPVIREINRNSDLLVLLRNLLSFELFYQVNDILLIKRHLPIF